VASDVRITFRGMEASPSVESQVRRRAEDLQRISDRMTACRVTMEAAHRHHHQGKIYHVHIDLAVPGGSIVVTREPGQDHAHEDLHELTAGPLAAVAEAGAMVVVAALALAAIYGLWLLGAAVAGGYLALWLLAWRETRELPDDGGDRFCR